MPACPPLFPTLLIAAVAGTGCASSGTPAPAGETPECATYRSMMTAPMAPSAMKQLRDACNASNQH